jgi:ribonucleoside-diphosphate reductase alpha subunit
MDLNELLRHHGQDLSVDTARILSRLPSRNEASEDARLEQAISLAAGLSTSHPDHELLAGRLAMHRLHTIAPLSFREAVEILHARCDREGNPAPAVSDELLELARTHEAAIQARIRPERDFGFDLLAVRTFEKSYLLRGTDGRIVERPQTLWMRVALGIHGSDLEAAFETYEDLSSRRAVHATPTLFAAGTPRPQMSSCFLLAMKADSIEGIYATLSDCARISQSAGGIGIHVHDIRAAGSFIAGTGGTSNGLVPMLRTFDATASYVDQGGGKRKGSIAVYLEPWHGDVVEWLDLKRNTGKDEVRCRNLFYGLWVPDLFMERVRDDKPWTLFDPHRAPGLAEAVGDRFRQLYEGYEAEGKGIRTLPARELWRKILEVQIETSMPYLVYKDAANLKSNQSHLGTIRSSNLCAEVIQYTSPEETAVCNLASVSLPAFWGPGGFDHVGLHAQVGRLVRNLDRIIERNLYPVPEAEVSNRRHRPMGIGVQGLADLFLSARLSWDDEEAWRLHREVFETLYHGAVSASVDLAAKLGPHPSFPGSPASQGLFQFDLWHRDRKRRGEAVPETALETYASGRWDWEALRELMVRTGLRNSLLVAIMPTASTASLLGNTEGIEPIPAVLYKRNVLSGEYVRTSRALVRDLESLGLWSETMKERIVAAEGSVQDIGEIPAEVRRLHRTVWELPQRVLVDLAAERGAFVCQSQSLNVFFREPTIAKLTSMHFHGWQKGLKTGSYYIRQASVRLAQKVTVDVALEKALRSRGPVEEPVPQACSIDNPDCEACSA